MPHSNEKHAIWAKVAGSGIAGFAELLIFHPVDTVAKRLMSYQNRVIGFNMASTVSNLNSALFTDLHATSAFQKYLSLFPGLSFAFAYKVSQRIYKFGGQPIVNDLLESHFGSNFQTFFGKKRGKLMMESLAGAMIGVGEVVLLPFDVLKIKKQTNPKTLEGRSTLEIFRHEKLGLYRGSLLTAARNAPGSFFLFGGSAFVKENIFHLENYRDATFFQHFIASAVGSIASIVVANPFDVVKTRIQNKPFDQPMTGMQITRQILAQEGLSAFMKGLTPKILTTGPKLIFSFTIAQYLIGLFQKMS